MRLDDLDPTDNARDLGSGGGGGGFGLLGLLPLLLGRRLGCGGILLIGALVLGYMYLSNGGMLGQAGGPSAEQSQTAGQSGAAVCKVSPERLEACRVMTSTDQTWAKIFEQAGRQYKPAMINFFEGGADTGCGAATSAVGPFYCSSDGGVYLDTAFFKELSDRFGARGSFARDYVIAHEMGHHVQDLLGTSEEVSRRQAAAGEAEGNHLSVQLELQADCFAGVWAARNRDRMEPGDIEAGMTAAQAIGDDTLQQEAQGHVTPEKFTHGTSAQRMEWLRRGLESGDPAQCDTFKGV
jgi:uncharacterized protein